MWIFHDNRFINTPILYCITFRKYLRQLIPFYSLKCIKTETTFRLLYRWLAWTVFNNSLFLYRWVPQQGCLPGRHSPADLQPTLQGGRVLGQLRSHRVRERALFSTAGRPRGEWVDWLSVCRVVMGSHCWEVYGNSSYDSSKLQYDAAYRRVQHDERSNST